MIPEVVLTPSHRPVTQLATSPLSVTTTNTEYLIGSLILASQLELIRRIDAMQAIDTLIGTVR